MCQNNREPMLVRQIVAGQLKLDSRCFADALTMDLSLFLKLSRS